MKNKIKMEVKQVYGRPLIYPACSMSRTFSELIGQKTFTSQHLAKIKDLGFTVEISNAPLDRKFE